jgi:hypothetical protein
MLLISLIQLPIIIQHDPQMKKLVFSTLILFLSAIAVNAQKPDGFSLIWEAREAVTNGDLQKAKQCLQKTAGADFGFCGNAHQSAFLEISLIRFEINLREGQIGAARENLEAIVDQYEANKLDTDSLGLLLEMNVIGRKRIQNSIEEGLSRMLYVEKYRAVYAAIPIDAGDTLFLPAPFEQEYPYDQMFIGMEPTELRLAYRQYFEERGLFRMLNSPNPWEGSKKLE